MKHTVPCGGKVTYRWTCTNRQPFLADGRIRWELSTLLHRYAERGVVMVLHHDIGDSYLEATFRVFSNRAFAAYRHRLFSRFVNWANRQLGRTGAFFLCTPKISIDPPS